ncbi:hypothetical protein Tco_0487127 [Tanacetum coccineum]
MQISQLKETRSEADHTLDFRALDFQIIQLTEKVTTLQEQNELFRAENAKVNAHYKDWKYVIDVEPIPLRSWNNREIHLDYLKYLKESVETLREIVEEAKGSYQSLVLSSLCTPPTNKALEYLFQPYVLMKLEPPGVEQTSSSCSKQFQFQSIQPSQNLTSTTIVRWQPLQVILHLHLGLRSPSIHQGVAAESTLVEENSFTPVDNDPFINIFPLEPTSEASSSGDVSSVESTYVTQILHHLRK